MAAKWAVKVHELAVDELRAMKQHDPAAFEEVQEVMLHLSMEADPRRPKNRRLNVCALRWDAPGWFRVRSFRLNLRVVFRVLERRDGRIIEVGELRPIRDDDAERALQITQAQPRARAYGAQLRQRRKKIA